jgi:hypothetical protein
VWSAYERLSPTGAWQWWFIKADRRVSCYYFYLWDVDFGPAFIKVCTYFPYPAKIWLNGHEWGIYNRLLVPLTAADQPQAPPQLRQALRTLDHHVDDYIHRARLTPAA